LQLLLLLLLLQLRLLLLVLLETLLALVAGQLTVRSPLWHRLRLRCRTLRRNRVSFDDA